MGKKGKKTIWRALPISEGVGPSIANSKSTITGEYASKVSNKEFRKGMLHFSFIHSFIFLSFNLN